MNSLFVSTAVVVWAVISETLAGEEYCQNKQDNFFCEHGCCGDYKEQHCCSFAGLIVGIVIGVGLLIAIIAGIIYCWLKKRWRAKNQVNFTRANYNCNGANVTVLHQSSTMAFTTDSSVQGPVFPAYTPSYTQPFPPPYSASVPQPIPKNFPPAQQPPPPPYNQPPPPYPYSPPHRTVVQGIGGDRKGSSAQGRNNGRSSMEPPPVS